MEKQFYFPRLFQRQLIKLAGFTDSNSFIREIQPGSFVYYRANALDPKVCAEMIRRFENDADKHTSTLYRSKDHPDVLDPKIRRATELDILERSEWQDIQRELLRSFDVTFKQLGTILPLISELGARFKGDGLIIQKTMPGEFYDWHFDFIPDADLPRHFSVVWYLNDVAEGGETEFYFQKLSVKPRAGSLVVFPANWTHRHRGAPPVSGVKYTTTSWLHYCKD